MLVWHLFDTYAIALNCLSFLHLHYHGSTTMIYSHSVCVTLLIDCYFMWCGQEIRVLVVCLVA